MAEDGKVKVAIKDLCFFYGEHKALNNISLSLYSNKVTAFIGPSGCGKSTLLRVLNRIYELYLRIPTKSPGYNGLIPPRIPE